MESSWLDAARNMESTCVASAKRGSGAMSHHEQAYESASTTAVSSQRVSREQLQATCPSYIPPRTPPRDCGRPILLSLLVILLTWTSLLGPAAAQNAHVGRRRSASLPVPPLENDLPAWKGPSLLVVDTRPPPIVPPLMHLQRRDGTPTISARASETTLETDATPSDFTVPRAFDTSLSNNFTAPCAAFFRGLITDSNFNDCHPFSLMLQTSSGFFDASKSYIRITRTLEVTCGVNEDQCTSIMDGLALELTSDANCAVDYANDNPQVLQAYNGLLAYEPLYQASCLRDDDGRYCYANAVTNTTATTDAYPYYLPVGIEMPPGARPTCNKCLQDVMAIFSSFGGNSTQPISQTYNGAAAQIDMGCGPTFVNKTATPLKGAAPGNDVSFIPTITLFVMLFLYFFQ